MIVNETVLIVIIYIFDGLFRGGMLVIFAEATAEVGYPMGESLSYGFVGSIQYAIIYSVNLSLRILVNPFEPDDNVIHEQQTALLWYYITLLVAFFSLSVITVVLLMRTDIKMNRSIEDAMLNEEDFQEEEVASQYNQEGGEEYIDR